jgi:ferrous iron transport protein A
MDERKEISLCQMHDGQSGRVIDIAGGRGITDRLNSIGIRPGKDIIKVSSAFMRGPVTIRVDRAQVAIGYGMAQKILVEIS